MPTTLGTTYGHDLQEWGPLCIAVHCVASLANSEALNVDGVKEVSVIEGGLLKKPDGCGVVPHDARPGARVALITVDAPWHVGGGPAAGTVARILITIAFPGETGLSSSKSCHAESDTSPSGGTRQVQQVVICPLGANP